MSSNALAGACDSSPTPSPIPSSADAIDGVEAPSAPTVRPGVTRLTDWGLIRARGDEAASFLQGQLTNDITHLPPGQARLAGFCSPKGRLLASFVVWQAAPGDWLLACSADVLPAALKRLSMFVLRARCKLSDASAELALWGVVGAECAEALGLAAPDQAWATSSLASPRESVTSGTGMANESNSIAQLVRLPDALQQPRFFYCSSLQDAVPATLPALPPSAWRWLEVHSGVVRIVAATVEHYVPQMVNFELVGGVDFKKGCFPGQEVVARSQYRGTLKRRGALLASPVALAEGQEVFHDADPGQPAGEVALAASMGEGQHIGLVELKLAALLTGSLHLGTADGPVLTPQPLPYPLPQDDA